MTHEPQKPKVAQVGGTHYETPGVLQHWDLMEAHDIAYLEANATKYIMRYDLKGTPAQDLRKAASYLDRVVAEGRTVLRVVPYEALDRFMRQGKLSDLKRALLLLILHHGHMTSIASALRMIDYAAQDLEGKA